MDRGPGRRRRGGDPERGRPSPGARRAAAAASAAGGRPAARRPGQRRGDADDAGRLEAPPAGGAAPAGGLEAEAVVSRVVLKRPRAEQDLLDHYVYVGERNPDAAERLL